MDMKKPENSLTNIILNSSDTFNNNQEKIEILSLEKETNISHHENLSIRQIEIKALEIGVVPERYLKNIGSLGLQGQIKLLESRVAVIGIGGLGSLLIELLARVGIGELLLIDGDIFVASNLNRQILLDEKSIGSFKTDLAKKRLKAINSAVSVDIFRGFLDDENAALLLKGCNVVADGLDNIADRLMLQSICCQLNIPLVYATVAGFVGQVCSIFPGDDSLYLIYGSEKPSIDQGVELQLGNLPATVGVTAALQSQEIVKIITNIGKPVRNKLLIIDTEYGEINTIDLSHKK